MSEVCPRLDFVPRLFPVHTSNPLSAKMNARDLSGELNNHVAASCDLPQLVLVLGVVP